MLFTRACWDLRRKALKDFSLGCQAQESSK